MLTGSNHIAKQDFCQNCGEQHGCQEVYEQLGHAQGPSVVPKVLAAFLLPLVVFIVSLAASERIIGRVVAREGLQTALGVVFALFATFICVVVTRAMSMRSAKSGAGQDV
jgi:hypothetical protein